MSGVGAPTLDAGAARGQHLRGHARVGDGASIVYQLGGAAVLDADAGDVEPARGSTGAPSGELAAGLMTTFLHCCQQPNGLCLLCLNPRGLP